MKGRNESDGNGIGRREFGKLLGAAGVSRALRPIESQTTPAEPAGATASPAQGAHAYTFFTAEEAAFVDAAVDRLIPPDDLGPGARDAGVTVFIDRQLSGAYGTAGKWYMQGPFGESAPEQGYQRPLTPQELYRVSIAALNALARGRHDERFDLLTPEQQDGILTELDEGTLQVEDAPVAEFFSMLLSNTMEGFFSDPMYGGNRDKVGWRLVGFPGVGASYRDRIEHYDEPYDVEPVSIEDVLDRRARVDEHGHVVHEPSLRSRDRKGRA
jgi:gluconate 2-dehydrogenase gamma chain